MPPFFHKNTVNDQNRRMKSTIGKSETGIAESAIFRQRAITYLYRNQGAELRTNGRAFVPASINYEPLVFYVDLEVCDWRRYTLQLSWPKKITTRKRDT